MLTGRYQSADDLPPNDYHCFFPWYQGDNFKKNLGLVAKVEKLAKSKRCNPTQLALSWIKTQSRYKNMPLLILIPGTTPETRVSENAKPIELTEAEIKEINDILSTFEVSSTRYPTATTHLTEF
ncbi:NADP-dependent oxidoreductase domain-containing protein [Xylariaceae sp. FL1651]|nr:NADP-dependent oxidoreductase domain-containing protein [Xylariaceae sp. FL1651]